MFPKNKRWLSLTITTMTFAVVLAIASAFVLAYRARAEAARYLSVVTPLRIGTTYNLVLTQLRDADIPVTLPRDCHRDCKLELLFVNKWQYLLHLAPPTALVGRLDFEDEKLVYKSTTLGQDFCCVATVLESAARNSSASVNVDSAGHQRKVVVDLSPLDFTEYRKQAYAFNVRCIGSMKGCEQGAGLLPTANDLEHTTSK